ncbi:MAG: 16S rRNA (uracil(1498)-N(3))-methyltransferase [Sporichthyaceae bacterium]
MSAPLFLLAPGTLPVSGGVRIDGPEGRHASRVRRLRVGEQVDVADGAGALARCRVTVVEPDAVTLEVMDHQIVPEPALRFVVVQALPKADRGELAVEMLTEVGVEEIVPWAAARCVTVWKGERAVRGAERWAAHAREAAKQARRPRVPRVAPVITTPGLLALVQSASLALVLHEQATEPLASVALPAAGVVLVVVGPEGGIDTAELTALVAAGGRAVRLGAEVLRTSTAGVAAVCVLSARGRWA